ncbi:MAG TPA: LamG domain-containing protein [Polyangiaceae bacterium]|nr:LamG domain-containing protein [Polyangiaceae bacterium]
MFPASQALSRWALLCFAPLACSLQVPSEANVFGAESGGAPAGGNEASGGVVTGGSANPNGGTTASSTGGTKANSSGGKAAGGAANGGSAESGAGALNAVDGLIAYFPLDETSGTVAANVVNPNQSGSYFGSCTHPSGKRGMAVGIRNQPSNSDWVELPDGLLSGLGEATVSIWVRDLSTARRGARLFDFSRGAGEGLYFSPDDDDPLASVAGAHLGGVHSGTSFVDIWAPSPVLTDKIWHHVAVTWSGTNISLYIDGTTSGSKPRPTASPDDLGPTTPNWLGKTLDDAFVALYAEIDEVRIYNRALEVREVGKLYQQP